MKRKICVVSGSRAEYGILHPLMKEIVNNPGLSLQIIATGMHLSPEFGYTYREIEEDGFTIDEKVETLLSSDTQIGVAKSMGLTMIALAESYQRLQPDIVLVLGDRFEILAAVAAAHISRIPVAHIGGGEITEGAFDDAFRHCITKMSHLHFVSTKQYRDRVIQLGESPERVFDVGEIGLDYLSSLKLLTRAQTEESLGIRFRIRNLLITYHPVTLENNSSADQMIEILAALDELQDTLLIFTKTNADTDGRIVNKMVDDYVNSHLQNSAAFPSLGRLKYLSLMQFVDAVVGNSSSGIVEAPNFRIGTVNIGDRQKGRIKASSVIDVAPRQADITEALQTVYSNQFKNMISKMDNPYYSANSVTNIMSVLENYDISHIIKKSFYTLPIIEK